MNSRIKGEIVAHKTPLRFVGNTGWLLSQQIYSMLVSLIIGVITARYLGPANYGLINYGASLVTLFSGITNLGIEYVIIREMINNPDQTGDFIGSALIMRLGAALCSMVGISVLVIFLEPGNTLLWIATILQSIALPFSIYEVFNYYFQSRLESKFTSIAAISATTAVGIWRIILLIRGTTVEWFALSSVVFSITCIAIISIIFFYRKSFKLTFHFSTIKRLFLQSYHFILSGLAVTIYMQIDKVMLGKMMGETTVGYYTAATTVVALWQFIPLAIISSARPIILEEKIRDAAIYLKRLRQLFVGISLLAAAVCLGFMLFGRWLILLLYGNEYLPAVIPMMILIWATGFAVIGTARDIWIIAEEYNKYTKYFTWLGAIFNVIANSFLIPKWGMTGAAVATLLSQIVVAFGVPLIWKETRRFDLLYLHGYKDITKEVKAISDRIRLARNK
jgi:O-antigen/teichoic acid export membrane protein